MKDGPVEADEEHRFRNVIESIPIGIHMYRLEPDGRLVFIGANPAADRLLGLDNTQFIGKTIEEAFIPLINTEVPERYRRAASDGEPWHTEQIEYTDEKISGAFEVHAFQTSPGNMVAAFINITDRKKTEEDLQASLIAISEEKGKIETILASLGVGISILDTSFRVLYQNQLHMDFGGEHLGEYCYKAYGNRESICEGCPSAISFSDGGIHTHEKEMSIAGRKRYFEITSSVLKSHKGEIISALEVVRDITIRKLMEESLRYRIAFERLVMKLSTNFINLPFGDIDDGINRALQEIGEFAGVDRSYIFLFDENGKLIDNTHEWCAPGIEPQIRKLKNIVVDEALPWFSRRVKNLEIVHVPIVEDLPPEASAERKEFERQSIQSLICVPMVFANSLIGFIGFDSVRDRKAWPEDSILLLRIISEIFANALARKQAEVARKESEDKYRDLFENANDAIFIVDADLKYRDINKRAVELFGYSRKEFLKMNIIDVIPPEQVPRSNREFDKLKDKRPYDKFVGKMKRKDGHWLDIEVSSSPILKDGRVVGSRDIVRDITERKRLEEELMKREKLESLGLLTGGLAHDFNNLLTSILGNISLARIPGQSPDSVYARLTDAENASLRARDLTQQLLTFSKGGAPVKKTRNIGDLLKESAAFALSGSAVKCYSEIPGDLWLIEADAGQMSQVINNLLINADQAMPEGGTIAISGENVVLDADNRFSLKEGKYAKITVKDQGGGIRQEHLRKIFDPYFTTKQKGSGLGLATVYSIIRRHDGYVDVESVPGAGTTFSLYFPASEKESAAEKSYGDEQPAGRGKILVMDDEEIVRNVVGEILTTMGYEVAFAGDGQEAVALYGKAKETAYPFDAVIMDLTVPGGMGGKEAIGKLLQLDPKAKVIVSSGYSQDSVMANFRDYGFAGVISKPYKVSELGAKLHDVLGASEEN